MAPRFPRHSILWILTGLSLAALTPAWGGRAFHMLRVQEVNALIESKEIPIYMYDVNTPETREKYGIIPGAALLSSSNAFNVHKELPSDKNAKLLFYCISPQCFASQQAAERALAAGYQDVNVFDDGIIGWTNAGQNTTLVKNR